MTFQFHALDQCQFAHLFDLNDDELAKHAAVRMTVKDHPGSPCRVTLEDAAIGEDVILVNYEHMSIASPFRATHAVSVRPHTQTAMPRPNEVPQLLRHRLISVRAFDAQGMMIDADVVEGIDIEAIIERFLKDPQTDELHIHYAKPGCFAARVTRV